MSLKLFILIIISSVILKALYKLFSKGFKHNIFPPLSLANELNSSFINQGFFNDIDTLLLSKGFEESCRKVFSFNEKNDNYLRYYVSKNKEMAAAVFQILSTITDENDNGKSITSANSLYFQLETYFKDGIHLISTSLPYPDYLQYPSSTRKYKYPDLTPEEIINEHIKAVKEFSKNSEIDYSYLESSFEEINEKESKAILEQQINSGLLKYNSRKDDYFLTIKGAFRLIIFSIKYILFGKKLHKRYSYEKSSFDETSLKTESVSNIKKDDSANHVIGLLIGVILIFLGTINIYKASQTKYWLQAKGEIISFEVIDDFDSVDAEVKYKYTINGQTYFSNRVSFGDSSSKNDHEVERLKQKFSKPGTVVEVYYNPDSPSKAVLEKGNNFFSTWPLLMGVIILFFSLPIKRKYSNS